MIGTFWLQNKLVLLLFFFIFRHFVPAFPFEKREKRALFFYGMREKESIIVFNDNKKMQTLGSTAPVGNSASFVSHWNAGSASWDFLVPTEHS